MLFDSHEINENNYYGIVNNQALQHLPISYFLSNLENFNEYFTFAVVRNPYSRFVSGYKWFKMYHPEIILNINFDEYIEFVKLKKENLKKENSEKTIFDDHFLSQTFFVCNHDNIPMVKIIKFENLHSEIEKIRNIFGITKELPHLNFTSEVINLTEEQKDKIYSLYEEDFINFSYEK